MKNPLISVVITTHNRPTLLERALDSLLKQSYENFEIILCSDESLNETQKVAQKKLRQTDTFTRTPNLRGPAETRNLGIKLANGDWICFLDDDDEFEEDYFKNAIPYLKDYKNAVITNYKYIYNLNGSTSEKNVVIQSIPIKNLLIRNFIPINSIFIGREVALRHKFATKLETHEDWDWLLSIYHDPRIKYTYANIFGPKIYTYSDNSRNYKKNNKIVHLLDYLTIYRRWPGKDEIIKVERMKVLGLNGINIPSTYL